MTGPQPPVATDLTSVRPASAAYWPEAGLDLGSPDLRDRWLGQMAQGFAAGSGLYARQLRDGAWGPTSGTECITSTAICMIGLARAGLADQALPAPPESLCARMLEAVRSQRYPGALGLVLWAAAVHGTHSPARVIGLAGLDPLTLQTRVLPGLTTMEVAWLVSGLLHGDASAFADLTRAVIAELAGRLSASTDIFLHAGPGAPPRHRLRRRLANFADQIYPLQALSFAAIVRRDAGLLQLAGRCATQVLARQGPLGQWWWLHDAATGRIADGFPVYSVHQHSMAPMALHAFAAAGGEANQVAIIRSRAWLWQNEAGIGMIEPEPGIIWRSLERAESGSAAMLRKARVTLGARASSDVPPTLRLNREMRPYEWGWLLYVTGIETAPPTARHIV